jgi:inner membrane protein
MDNITHSLFGVALGSVALAVAPRARELPKHSSLVVWTAILANNAPDIDVFLPSLLKGGSLMGLLEHRGFTHTVLAAPFLSIVVVGVAWLFSLCPRLSWRWFWGLFGLSILGVLMHLGADYCNDYGVHPFSPFNNKWFYGDFIFIVEPLIWFSILPLAFFGSKKWILKGLVIILYLALTGVLLCGPYASFYSASQKVGAGITEILEANRPGEKIVQLARTPAPADPFCWKAVVVSEGPGDQYTIRSAAVSLLPRFINPSSCLHGMDWTHTVQLAPTSLPAGTASFEVTWQGEFRRELSELGRLDQEFCQFHLLRQFARAPFWSNDEEGWYAGDFRYDRGTGHGFASVRFATSGHDTPCPGEFPPGFKGWDPPVAIK